MTITDMADEAGDYRTVGRTNLKWAEAIQRAIEESEMPLSSLEIANIVYRNCWIRRRGLVPDAAAQTAIGQIFKRGNDIGLVALRGPGRSRKYWLDRKGVPPMTANDAGCTVTDAPKRTKLMSLTPEGRAAIEVRMLEVRRQIVAIDLLDRSAPGTIDQATFNLRSNLIDQLVDLRLSFDS